MAGSFDAGDCWQRPLMSEGTLLHSGRNHREWDWDLNDVSVSAERTGEATGAGLETGGFMMAADATGKRTDSTFSVSKVSAR